MPSRDLSCGVCGEILNTYESRHELEHVPQVLCDECVYLYSVAKANGRADATSEEIIASARLLKLFRALSPEQQDKLQRLLVLLRNQSPRANRLLQMAVDGKINLEELLSIV